MWRLPILVAALALTLFFLSFASRPSRASEEPSASAGEAETAEPDPRESLRAAELAFAVTVAERDRDGFASFLDSEAIFVAGSVLRGAEAIVEGWSVFFAEDGPRLEWHPDVVEVQDSGALGLTRGPYTLTRAGEDGSLEVLSGSFSSIWRRQADGSWKVVFDSGCPPG